MKQVLALIYATVVCLGLQAQNKTYYVSPSGNDCFKNKISTFV